MADTHLRPFYRDALLLVWFHRQLYQLSEGMVPCWVLVQKPGSDGIVARLPAWVLKGANGQP